MPTQLLFLRHGEFQLAGHAVQWKESERGDILLKEAKSDASFYKYADFMAHLRQVHPDIVGQADLELNAVNQLLVRYRPHALPDDNGYFAAAAGVCEGRLFVAVNNEQVVKHAFAGRGCAETTMLRKCQESTGNSDAQVKFTYLLSGKARKLPSGGLLEETPGARSCLCGECRQNLRAHTQKADFIMLPVNDGRRSLSMATSKNGADLKPNEAWCITHEQLYPTAEYVSLSAEDSGFVRAGYDAITDHAIRIPRLKTDLPEQVGALTPEQYERLRDGYERPTTEIKALKEYPSLENINCALLHLIKRAYHKHSERGHVPNLEITAILLKTEKGEFYPSVVVNGDLWLPSKPPEIPTALSNAYNQKGISEAYMMTFDNYQLQNERTEAAAQEHAQHLLKMPDPAGLGRLLKNMKQEQSATLRVLPINDGKLPEAILDRISGPALDVRAAFGPEFTNPKRSVAAGRD